MTQQETAFPTRAETTSTSPTTQGQPDISTPAAFQATLKAHQICFLVPAGAKIDGHTFDLPGGILILGALRGRVRCSTGSALILAGGEFQGNLEANDVIIEGRVTSPADVAGKPTPAMSEVRARGQTDTDGRLIGGILALSGSAFACAKLHAVSFSIPRSANLSRSVLQTIG